jgi:hypothetical protein
MKEKLIWMYNRSINDLNQEHYGMPIVSWIIYLELDHV